MIMPRPNARFALEIDNTQETNAAMRTGLVLPRQAIPAALSAHAHRIFKPACARCQRGLSGTQARAHVHGKYRAGSEALGSERAGVVVKSAMAEASRWHLGGEWRLLGSGWGRRNCLIRNTLQESL